MFRGERIDRTGSYSSKWRKYAADILPLWVADADYPCAPAILEALSQRVQHGIFGYTDPDGAIDTVVDYFYRGWRWRIEPEWIVFSPGLGASIHTLSRLRRYLTDNRQPAAGSILVPTPIYRQFRDSVPLAGERRIDVDWFIAPSDANAHWRVDVELLRREIADDSWLLHFCNPHNPNGVVFDKAQLEAIAEICCEHDLLIGSDEVWADLIYAPEATPHIPIASLHPEIAQRSVTLQSPSKCFNIAGLNCAVCIIPNDELRAAYRRCARGQVISHINPFGIEAMIAAWSGECDEWLMQQRAFLWNNHQRLIEAVRQYKTVKMSPLQSTYLAWLDMSHLAVEEEGATSPDSPYRLHRHLMNHGLGLSPGYEFGKPDYMRLNFACAEETLIEAITRLDDICR